MKRHFFILTQNFFLFNGIRALLPDECCHQIEFEQVILDECHEPVKSVTIIVDCTIYYSGNWQGFSTLLLLYPNAEVIWMLRGETGLVFPEGRAGDVVIKYRDRIDAISSALHKQPENIGLQKIKSSSPWLTRKEKILLPLFISDVHVMSISIRTGSSTGTLYAQRTSITKKTGFRSFLFMQYILSRNSSILLK